MNKGIQLSTGEVIGILNSDDVYTSNKVVAEVATQFNQSDIGALFGDLHYFKNGNSLKSYRKYSSRFFKPWMFRWGFMPPHPTFFVRKEY